MKKTESGFSVDALRRILSERLGEVATLKVAYSGGIDSHTLLHALCQLRTTTGWKISALHVNHGLQAESDKWAEHCLRVCRDLEVSCVVGRIQVEDRDDEGLEAAARRLRYAWLAKHVDHGDVLMTAHHLDDQAETILLQLLRGSGVRGLAAMPIICRFSAGKLVRPLLEFERSELKAYAKRNSLRWVEDASNRDVHRSRNFIRHRVVPMLEQHWPRAKHALVRGGRHAGEAATLLDAIALEDMQSSIAAQDGCEVDSVLLVPALLNLSAERRHNVLRYWIRQLNLPPPSSLHMNQIDDVIVKSTRSRHAAVAWPGAEVRRYRNQLFAMRRLTDPDPGLKVTWNLRQPIEVPGTGYVLKCVESIGDGLSRERIGKGAITVRLRQGGETCCLPGRSHHHKLKKLLQEAGVPPWQRQRLPLIFVDEDLAAVADRWVCAPYAARPDEPGLQVALAKAKIDPKVDPVV